MFKSTMTHPAAPPLRADQPEQGHDSATQREQAEQARHRTAIRIVGIEGIEVFADLADADKPDGSAAPGSQSR